MLKVVLDTNFLLIPFHFKVDVFEGIREAMDQPYQLCILEGTVRELKKIIREQGGKDRQAARLALELLVKKRPRMLPSGDKGVDEALLDLSPGHIIATQDQALRKKLRKQGKRILLLRQRRYVRLG